jgi:hypothetical protein
MAFRGTYVQIPIIGVDLLAHYELLGDCINSCMLYSETSLSTPGFVVPPSVHSVKVIEGDPPSDSFLEEFPELIKPTGMHREVRKYTTHHIRTKPGLSVACCPLRRAPDRLAAAKAGFNTMLQEGTARSA